MKSYKRKLIDNILEYLTNCAESDSIKKNLSRLIRIHSENLKEFGEISFSAKYELWLKYEKFLTENGFQLLMINNDNETLRETINKFVKTAQQWCLPVNSITKCQGRYHIHLQRVCIVKQVIGDILNDTKYGYFDKSNTDFIYLHKLSDNAEIYQNYQNLSHYRILLLHTILQRLLIYSKYSLINDENELVHNNNVIHLIAHSVMLNVQKQYNAKTVKVKCGFVLDPADKKRPAKISTEDYKRLRSNDMYLLVLHKYGIRVKQDEKFRNLVEQLGSAAVTIDLMEVKHTSPVNIIRSGNGSSKGASFILYNSARMETLLRQFDERTANGIYDPLPNFHNIECDILCEKEEWQLVFVYLLGFPHLIECCLDQLQKGYFPVHLIIRFLQGLVAVFSVYYRKTKILTQKRQNLMPYVYARIYFIKAVRTILNNTMALLGINPVDFM